MVSVAFPTILSVLLVILLGFILSRTLLENEAFWSGVSRLCYWILFPILLFDIISETSLSGGVVLPIILILTSALILIILLSILTCYLSGFERSSASSVIQGSFRHNGFIGFAIAPGLLGTIGTELAAICIAILVPITNIAAVIVMIVFNRQDTNTKISRFLLKEITRNPLIIAVVLGLLFNYFEMALPTFATLTFELLGDGALSLLLLCVGAGLAPSFTTARIAPLFVAILMKLIIFPAMVVTAGIWAGLPADIMIILAIFAAMPCAVSAFPLAKQLGGNAPLMADIIVLQTVFSLPLSFLWLFVVS